MSQTTIHMAANDPDLQARVQASVYDEAFNNDAFKDTLFAQQVVLGQANLLWAYWAAAVATEGAYEAGILNGRGAPGHDRDVITDAQITAAVQAEWPMAMPPAAPIPTTP